MAEIPKLSGSEEFELVTICSRKSIDEGARGRVRELLSADSLDMNLVLRLAAFHGVHPLLYQNLSDSFGDFVSDEILANLRGVFLRTAAHNLSQGRELGRVANLLDDAGVRVIAFKGPVLSAETYENMALRPSTDLDIFIDREQFERVADLLERDGFRRVVREDSSSLSRAMHQYLAQQAMFYRTERGLHAFDIHLDIMPPGYYYPFSFDTLYERSHEVSIAGTTVRSFQAEDLLQILCLQGVKNRWERLKHVCDVAMLVQSEASLDWDVIEQRARQTRGEGILIMGLYLIHVLFDVELPDHILKRVLADPRSTRFGTWFLQRLPDHMESGIADFGERFRFYLGIQDTILNKVRYCLYSVVRRME